MGEMTNRAEDMPSSEIGFISEAEEERERDNKERITLSAKCTLYTLRTHVSLDRRGRIARIDRRIRNVPTCVHVCKQGEVDAMY